MAEFAGHAAHAVENLAVENDGPADAGAQGQHGHVVGVASRAHPFLAEGGDVGVVVEIDASSEAAFNHVAHGIVLPAGEVGGFPHHAGGHIDDSRDADSRAQKFSAVAIFFCESLDRVTHFTDDVVPAHRDLYAQGYFLEKLAVGGNGRHAQVGTAH